MGEADKAITVLGHRGPIRIATVVEDMVAECRGKNEIKLSQPVLDAVEAIKEFMFTRVYFNEAAKREEPKAQNVVKRLFRHYLEHLEELPEMYRQEPLASDSPARRVCDYVAGFTDRFAIKQFVELFPGSESLAPREWDV